MRKFLPTVLSIIMLLLPCWARASIVPWDSNESDVLDHLMSGHGTWLRGVTPISKDYSLSLLQSLDASDSYHQDLAKALFEKISHSIWNTDKSYFNLRLQSLYEYLRKDSLPLLQIDAVTNPMLSQNHGMFADGGHHGMLGIDIDGKLTSFFSFRLSPYFLLSSHNTALDDHHAFFLREAVGSLHVRKFVLDLGRTNPRWGVGKLGHLLFSSDYEPFTMVRLRSNRPVIPPSFLKILGPTHFDAFFTLLGEDYVISNARLIGLYFTFLPHHRFEFGFGQTVIFGGSGAPTNNPSVFFTEAFTDVPNPANRNFLFTFRYLIPGLEFEAYTELMVEDCCGTPPLNARDTANLIGFYFPRVDPKGRADFTIEWIRTTHITYRHGTFTDGYVFKNHILGHPLGPDATGAYALLRYFISSKVTLKTQFAFELRGRRGVTSAEDDSSTIFPSFERGEQRYRWMNEVHLELGKSLNLTPRFGLEHIVHENYVRDQKATNVLIGFKLEHLL